MLLVENTISFLTEERKRQDMTIPHSIGKWITSLKKTWASSFLASSSKGFKKNDTSNCLITKNQYDCIKAPRKPALRFLGFFTPLILRLVVTKSCTSGIRIVSIA